MSHRSEVVRWKSLDILTTVLIGGKSRMSFVNFIIEFVDNYNVRDMSVTFVNVPRTILNGLSLRMFLK